MTLRLPMPRTPDPAAAPVLRWGIIGPGWIAERFVEALRRNTSQQVVAVGSRNHQRAQAFASVAGIDRAHGGYDALLADSDVDIVYVATPHTEHFACAAAALAAGKHVLVEKPLGLNAIQAEKLFAMAREANLFVGEAMWTRFLPKFDVIAQVLDAGLLGEIRTVIADHGEFFTADHRIYNPALAGGPMLDLGSYPVAFACWALGAPIDVAAIGQPANDDLNGQISAMMTHAGGQSLITTTILANTPTVASISGSVGYLQIPGPFYQPGPVTVVLNGGDVATYDEPHGAHAQGLHFSAADAARTIAAGGIESAVHSWADVAGSLAAMDAIRAEVGIVFPGE